MTLDLEMRTLSLCVKRFVHELLLKKKDWDEMVKEWGTKVALLDAERKVRVARRTFQTYLYVSRRTFTCRVCLIHVGNPRQYPCPGDCELVCRRAGT